MKDNPRKTIVVLEMRPNSPRATGGGFLRICDSGYGSGVSRAERELNSAIETSENGRRDLVPLHRLRAVRAYSKATSLEPIESVLALVHSKVGKAMKSPKGGFFDVSLEEAIQAIEDGLVEFEKKLVSRQKRQSAARKTHEKLEAHKRVLEPLIENVVRESQPHPEELRDALDGLDGKSIQTWAEKQLTRLQKAKEAAAKKAEESQRLRELTVGHAKDVHFDAVALREIQRQIEALDDERFVLTESEEHELEELEQDVFELCGVIDDWKRDLPQELQDYAEIVLGVVHKGCPLAGSFEDLVREILIDNWDEYDDSEDWSD